MGEADDGGDSAAERTPADGESRDRDTGIVRHTVRRLGSVTLTAVAHAGRAGILFVMTIRALRRPGWYWNATIRQAKRIGADSVALVMLVGALGGSILAQQSGYQFTTLPASMVVGEAVAAGLLTELAPVLTAVVLAGQVGAGIGAELGSMKVGDQLAALRTLGRDPVVELVVPRVLAGGMMLVPLVILANAAGLASGWLTAINLLPMNTADYVASVRGYYHPAALIFSLGKAVVFGFTTTFLACYVGMRARGGAEGVGRTATRAAVSIIVAILVLDVVLAPLYKALR